MAARDTTRNRAAARASAQSEPVAKQRRPAISELDGMARAQRLLAVMAVTVFALTAIAIAVLLIQRVQNVPRSAYRTGVLQFLSVFPTAGIAVFLLLVVAAIVINVIHRSRTARRG